MLPADFHYICLHNQHQMPEQHTRRLAAILFADIAGYTALMQHDEQEALEKLARFKSVLETQTAEYRGDIIQYYGDAGLVVFNSPFDAVACAKSLQEAFRETPRPLPDETGVPVRIGIHLGDVVFKENNVFGDAVNIASRVESMGVPGAVLLSQTVRSQIKNHPEFQLASLGNFDFKNVDEPMEVFALANEGFPVPKLEEMEGKLKTPTTKNNRQLASWKKRTLAAVLLAFGVAAVLFWKNSTGGGAKTPELSIAVLPFANLNDDPEQDYFSDGITDDIRNRLAGIREIKVISRTSCMFFKNKNVPLRQIGKELSVRYILGGSIQKSGEIVKISVELNDAQSDRIIWTSPVYEQEVKDIFALQAQLSHDLVRQLKVRLTADEARRLAYSKEVDPEVYNLGLKALYQNLQFTSIGYENAFRLANQILEMDSSYALAYSLIAQVYVFSATWAGSVNPKEASAKATPYIEKLLQINPDLPDAYTTLGVQKFLLEWDFKSAEKAFRTAAELGDFFGLAWLAFLHCMEGNHEESIRLAKEVEAINPFYPQGIIIEAIDEFFLGNPNKAIRLMEEGIRLNPIPDFYYKLGKYCHNTGQSERAIHYLNTGMDTFHIRPPGMLAELAAAHFKNKEPEKANVVLSELKTQWQQGKSGSCAFFIAQTHASFGQKELVFEWLEKSFKAHDVEMIWLKIEPQFKSLHGDPRYREMLRKVGFSGKIKG